MSLHELLAVLRDLSEASLEECRQGIRALVEEMLADLDAHAEAAERRTA
jgi:hypothetical protein